MSQVFKNGARTELDTAIAAAATQFTVLDGTIFPVASASVTGNTINQTSGDWFKLVLQDDNGNFEIVYCYGHESMTHTFTVIRGQEGTTAQNFSVGTTVGLRLLSSDLDNIHSTLTLLGETKQDKAVPAAKADALTAARTITLSGAVQANASWDASGALELVTNNIDVSKANGGTLVVARGGTGATSHTAGQVLVGNGSNPITSRAIDTTTSGTPASGSLITSGAVNAGLALKANLDSPALTGTPTAPTAVVGTNTTQLANTAFVTTAVSNAVSTLLGSAPAAALDTLKELGDALGNDPDFAATMTNALASKVDKVTGKGLSTNDFTTALLNKLNGVADGANNFSLPAGTNGQVLKHNGTAWVAGTDNNTTYGSMSAADANTGTATTAQLITAEVLKGAITTHAPIPTNVSGNAGTATKLATAHNLTIGATAKAFDGSATVSWSLAEIGAAAASHTHSEYASASHTHSYLPLTGGTLTGNLIANDIQSQGWLRSTGNAGWYNQTYGGGLYMEDATWVRVYNGKYFLGTEICATGNVTAYYSDRRLKTNLRPIKGALESIASLTGYRYNANKTAAKYGYDPEREEVGLMAQDVQKFAPEVVEQAPFDRTDKEGESKTGEHYLTLKYERLVPYLVEAIKELNAKVNKLEELLESRA